MVSHLILNNEIYIHIYYPNVLTSSWEKLLKLKIPKSRSIVIVFSIRRKLSSGSRLKTLVPQHTFITCILGQLTDKRPSTSSCSMYQNLDPRRDWINTVDQIMGSHTLDHGGSSLFKGDSWWHFNKPIRRDYTVLSIASWK